MANRSEHSDEALLELVGEVYDCAIEPARWPATLERLAALLDGNLAAISLQNTANQRVSLRSGWNVEPAFEEAMKSHFAINPLVSAVWYAEVDEPYTALGFLGEDQLKNSRWHREAVAPFHYGDVLMTLLAKSGKQFGSLSFFRHQDKPAFGHDELKQLRLLAPHIRRAVMIANLLDARALERDMLSTTLDLVNVGIILTDACAEIVHANHAGLAFLDDASALRRSGDLLSARDRKCARDLREAIAEAASGSTINIPKPGIAVPITGLDGRDLAAWVLPLDGGLRRDLATSFAARAAVFVRELGDASPFPAELFVRRFGVTPAECRVLMLLTQGMTAAQAAESLGISLTTVKTHLARLFDKTGTQRQTDLVRLAISAFAPASA